MLKRFLGHIFVKVDRFTSNEDHTSSNTWYVLWLAVVAQTAGAITQSINQSIFICIR